MPGNDTQGESEDVPSRRLLFASRLACGLTAAGTAHLLRKYFSWDDWVGVVLAVAFYLALSRLGFITRSRSFRFRPLLWSLLPLLFFGVWYAVSVEFGYFDIGSVLIHLQMGFEANAGTAVVAAKIIDTAIVFLLLAIGLAMLACLDDVYRRLDKYVAVLLLMLNPAVGDAISLKLTGAEHAAILTDRFTSVQVTPPADSLPRNLLHIYLESAERTFQDSARFGDIMSPLLPLESRGVSAVNMRQVNDTHYSMAGMVSSMCGVPLLSLGLTNSNVLEAPDVFLGNLRCLGDVLRDHGYEQTFMYGTRLDFSGADRFFHGHGYQNLVGSDILQIEYPEAIGAWGVHDEAVFAGTLSRLRDAQSQGTPFNFTVKTTGGHAPEGYVSPLCDQDPDIARVGTRILRAVKCTNELAVQFLQSAEAEGLLDNTVVVVQSDHLMMKNAHSEQLQNLDRTNLFLVFGEGIEPQQHLEVSSLIDVFPTILVALGFQLENSAAGLGVDLLSQEPTLTERLGEKGINLAIRHDTSLRFDIWDATR